MRARDATPYLRAFVVVIFPLRLIDAEVRQSGYPNVIHFNHRKMPVPVVAAFQSSYDPINEYGRRRFAGTKENNAADCRESTSEGKFAEIFIKRYE